MKKFMTLCLAALMMLASATAIVADDDVVLISAEGDAAVEVVAVEEVVAEEKKEIVDLLVIDDVNTPKTAPLFVTAFGHKGVYNFNEFPLEKSVNSNYQYPTGKAVVPFAFPRQVTITVDAGENGTVDVPAKFFAACTSSRTFNITANEGYEIADILVNGVSYGPAYSVKLKNIQVSMDIEVVFAPIVVEEEAVETVAETEVVEAEVEVVEAETEATEVETEATEAEAEVAEVETEAAEVETEAAEVETEAEAE